MGDEDVPSSSDKAKKFQDETQELVKLFVDLEWE